MKIIRQVVAALVLALAVVVVQDRRAVEASHYGFSCPDMQAQCRNMGGTPYYNSECAAGTNPFVWQVCVLPWSPSQAYFCCPSELCECVQPTSVYECTDGLCNP